DCSAVELRTTPVSFTAACMRRAAATSHLAATGQPRGAHAAPYEQFIMRCGRYSERAWRHARVRAPAAQPSQLMCCSGPTQSAVLSVSFTRLDFTVTSAFDTR